MYRQPHAPAGGKPVTATAMTEMAQFSPGMLSYPEPPEFDYGAFLQADDVTFQDPSLSPNLAASGPMVFSDSSGRATPPSSDTVSSSGAGEIEVARRAGLQRQRLERRGHTKSRRGCFNCKRRRIKVRGSNFLPPAVVLMDQSVLL